MSTRQADSWKRRPPRSVVTAGRGSCSKEREAAILAEEFAAGLASWATALANQTVGGGVTVSELTLARATALGVHLARTDALALVGMVSREPYVACSDAGRLTCTTYGGGVISSLLTSAR